MGPARSEGARESIPSHKSAEPNLLAVMMAFADRDALVEDDPVTYYLKEHYLNYPCVLVRLTRIRLDALRDLVVGAHRFVNGQMRASGTPAAAEAPLGHHAIAADRS
jgi:hypothetical protein